MKTFAAILALAAFSMVQGDLLCSTPDCTNASLRNKLWPHPDQNQFYQCALTGGSWIAFERSCQCGTFFSYVNQRCEIPGSNWIRWCPSSDPNAVPNPCAPNTTTGPRTTLTPPTISPF